MPTAPIGVAWVSAVLLRNVRRERTNPSRQAGSPVGLYPYFDAGLVTVSADYVDTSFMGHIYFASAPELLLDMHLLFGENLPPQRRVPPLAGRESVFGHDYWVFAKAQAPPANPK